MKRLNRLAYLVALIFTFHSGLRAEAVVVPDSCQRFLDADLFEAGAYRKYNPDSPEIVAAPDNDTLALHWCTVGLYEGRQASEVFSSKEFLAMNPTLAAKIGAKNYKDAALLFVGSPSVGRAAGFAGVKIGASPFFTRSEYQALNPTKVFSNDTAARRDFLLKGLPAGLAASSQFNAKEYFALYPEKMGKCRTIDQPDYICAAQEFRDFGIAESRQGVFSSNFLTWAALAGLNNISPEAENVHTGDLVETWVGADGRTVKAVVHAPHPVATAPTVVLEAVAPGTDARPAFERAIAQAKALKAKQLNIPLGTYTFLTTNNAVDRKPHLYLKDLQDITINGNGSTLVFTQRSHGLVIESNHRVKLQNFKIEYGLKSTSLGTIVLASDGTKRLQIDDAYPVTADDGLAQLQEYDRAKKDWVISNLAERVLFAVPLTAPYTYKFEGNQQYSSPAFKNLTVGKTFAVMNHWYIGNAIFISEYRNKNESEDVWLNGVTIHSAPGMGVVPYGMKRGFAMTGCQIVPKPVANSFMSVEWDGVHLISVGGDTIIKNNIISKQGDDGLNLNSMVMPVLSLDNVSKQLLLGTFSRFVAIGDRLGFFDSTGQYLGMAIAKAVKQKNGIEYYVDVDREVNANAKVVKSFELINNRTIVKDNTFTHGGVLAQTPNTLIDHNFFNSTLAGVRVVANVGLFKEGTGAFNTIVRRNTINNSGWVKSDSKIPWGTITVVGRLSSGYAAHHVHRNLEISDNVMTGAQQSCISLMNAENTVIKNNTCTNTNLQAPGSSSIRLINSSGIEMSGNKRNGSSTGPILTDGVVEDANVQVDY